MTPFVSESEEELKEEIERLETKVSDQRIRIHELEETASNQNVVVRGLETENENLRDSLQQILEKARGAL